VHDWPAWAPGPTPPPPPNPWRYTLDASIGRLSATRNSLQLDTTGLPPAVAPAPPPPPPPGTGGGSGGGGGSGVGPGAIGLAEAILHDEALPVTASRVVAAVLAPAAEVWGEAEAGPVSVPYAPALLYEAFAGRRDSARRSDIGGRFQALALPRMRPDTPLAAGDLFVRRPAGEGSLAHAGLLLTGELVRHGELACRGWAAERSAPGWYALVVEGGPFPHCAHRPFARRILDERGAVPPGQLLLRARTRTRLHAPASGENLGALTTGEAPTAMQLTVRNRLLRWDAIAGCEVELTHHDFDTPVLARTDAHGQAQLDLQGVRDGSYNMYVRPPHGSADPVGPALAATTPRPARIWRPLTTVVTVKDARIVASSDPRVIPAGAALTILVQPVWIASPNESARPGGAAALTRIIVHHTSGPLIGPALNTALAAKPPAGEPRRSAHYFIDTDGEIVKMVHEERASWHAGVAHWGGRDDLNDTTVGIEIVHQRGTYPAAQYDALIGLLQRIRAAYPAIAATSIVGHSDIGTCPLPGGPDGCNQPPRRLGRKSGDPGLDFEWERLEAQGLGIVVPAATTLAASAYGGFFAAVADGRLQPNDRDAGHRYGGAARPSITTDVIRELQRDLRDIGYYCPDSGRYDVPTQRAVRTFQEHFFAGTRPRAAHAGEVDAATAERIKAVRPAPVAPVAPVVPAPAVPLQQEAAVAPAPPQGAAAELHRVTTRLPLTGKRVRVTKSIDARTGAIEIVAADAASGARVDLAALREAERRAHAARYGKLHPTLFRELQRHRPTDAIPIAIWVHAEEPVVDKGAHLESRAAPPLVANREDYDEASTGRTGEPIAVPTPTPPPAPAPLLAYRGIVAEARARVRQELEQRLHLPVPRELQTVPLLMTTATREQIRAIGQVRDVDAIYLHDERGVNDLGTSMVDSRADRAVDVMGWRGTNIRVAVWEPGPDDLTQLQVAEHFVAARTETATHARLTTAIIKNRQTTGPKGYAPDCLMYSANNYTLEALEWAVVTKECTVVNQSFHRDAEQTDGTLSLDDRVKDYLAVHWPFPTIIQAAGNSGTPGTEYVNHKGYNSLTVGNHLDGATRIDAQSVFRNPTSPHGDRELPEITANGDSVTAAGHTDSGTSFAAPAVAGAAALLQNADNALIHWPEGVRAILLAAADRNLEGKGWWHDVVAKVDAKDGSGVLDAAESVRIALSRRRPGAPAAQRGWDVGNLLPTDFDATGRATFAYQVAVPASETNPKHVKVALAWNAATTHTPASGSTPRAATSELTLDHDLLVFDGTRMVAASGSYDNSYEIAEFEGQPGRSYTIVIRRALTAPAERTWYGVAWTAP
jgi:N-acetyl-anhydromuramyl-L-alanine amidase AmpD